MRKRQNTKINYIVTGILTAAGIGIGICAWEPLTAEATVTSSDISGVKDSINKHQNELDSLNSQISHMQDEQDLLQEEIDDLNSEIINTMTSIGMKEDEIAAKEEEITDKQAQITVTEAEYEAALAQEEKQKENMAAYARLMYEKGETSYLSALLEGKGLSDILNRMGYIERVYQYAKQVLDNYISAKNTAHDLWDRLEEEKAALERDMRQLETDRLSLENQKTNLNGLLEQKKKASANFEAEIEKARQEAAVAKKLLQQEQQRLKSLEAQLAAQQAAQNAAGGNYVTSYNSVIDGASGSELGKQIAKYACQYIGNPYVYGGTSLTNGTDCSGFTYKVYSIFGYSLPRTSYAQQSAGRAVSYENAEPGDIICYEGHVGFYIGGGLIVHASNSKPYPSGGIKVSNAQYKPIVTVRRIVN